MSDSVTNAAQVDAGDSDRTLPKLPAGWRLNKLTERVRNYKNFRYNGGKLWRCNLRPGTEDNGDYKQGASGDGDSPREAVMDAIRTIVRLAALGSGGQ